MPDAYRYQADPDILQKATSSLSSRPVPSSVRQCLHRPSSLHCGHLSKVHNIFQIHSQLVQDNAPRTVPSPSARTTVSEQAPRNDALPAPALFCRYPAAAPFHPGCPAVPASPRSDGCTAQFRLVLPPSVRPHPESSYSAHRVYTDNVQCSKVLPYCVLFQTQLFSSLPARRHGWQAGIR